MTDTDTLPPVIATLKQALESMGHVVTTRKTSLGGRRFRISNHPGELPGDAFIRKAEKITAPAVADLMKGQNDARVLRH